MKKLLAVVFAAILMLVISGSAFADPNINNEFPVCGSQADQTTLVLNCADYTKVPDQQFYTVPGTGSQSMKFNLIWKEGIFQDELDAFTVDDAAGTIGALHPGDAGYLNAAYQRTRVVFGGGMAVPSPNFAPNGMTFNGGDLVVFMLVRTSLVDLVNTNPTNDPSGNTVAYFSMDALNPDHADHMLAWQNGKTNTSQFSFEDWIAAGGDYNDLAFNVFADAATPSEDFITGVGSGDVGDSDFIFQGGGCGASATVSGEAACSAAATCKGANTRLVRLTGYADWKQYVTHIELWHYDAGFSVCIDTKRGFVMDFTGQTQSAKDVLQPFWTWNHGPIWDFGPTGNKVKMSFARVTDSFQGCPPITVGGLGCHTITVTITWQIDAVGGFVTKSVNFTGGIL
jgi:hypothetical protein